MRGLNRALELNAGPFSALSARRQRRRAGAQQSIHYAVIKAVNYVTDRVAELISREFSLSGSVLFIFSRLLANTRPRIDTLATRDPDPDSEPSALPRGEIRLHSRFCILQISPPSAHSSFARLCASNLAISERRRLCANQCLESENDADGLRPQSAAVLSLSLSVLERAPPTIGRYWIGERAGIDSFRGSGYSARSRVDAPIRP